MNQGPYTSHCPESQRTIGDSNTAAGPQGGQPSPQVPSERIVGNFVVESGVPLPSHWERSSKHEKFPFGELAVGQSIVIRGVNQDHLDRVIDSWRKRKSIDMGRVRIHGSALDEFRVFRRG